MTDTRWPSITTHDELTGLQHVTEPCSLVRTILNDKNNDEDHPLPHAKRRAHDPKVKQLTRLRKLIQQREGKQFSDRQFHEILDILEVNLIRSPATQATQATNNGRVKLPDRDRRFICYQTLSDLIRLYGPMIIGIRMFLLICDNLCSGDRVEVDWVFRILGQAPPSMHDGIRLKLRTLLHDAKENRVAGPEVVGILKLSRKFHHGPISSENLADLLSLFSNPGLMNYAGTLLHWLVSAASHDDATRSALVLGLLKRWPRTDIWKQGVIIATITEIGNHHEVQVDAQLEKRFLAVVVEALHGRSLEVRERVLQIILDGGMDDLLLQQGDCEALRPVLSCLAGIAVGNNEREMEIRMLVAAVANARDDHLTPLCEKQAVGRAAEIWRNLCSLHNWECSPPVPPDFEGDARRWFIACVENRLFYSNV